MMPVMDWGPAARRRLGRAAIVLLAAAFTVLAVGLLLKAFASDDDAEIARLTGYADILALVLGAASALVGVCRWATSRPASADVLESLAGAVFRQWSKEARRLDLSDELAVAWTALAAHDQARTPGRRRSDRGWPAGGAFVEAFRRLPDRRLVLLGSAGAGKTAAAMGLVLELTRVPRDDGPVPVLVGLAGWDPGAEDLDPWLARRLAETYPTLSVTTALDLVERGRVMPILDGLDEVAQPVRDRALTKISETAVGRRPLVLTCRREEYDRLVASGALLVANASVWCLEPLGPAELVRYLTDRRPRGDRHWSAVLDHVRADPDGPLAAALSTPLMASMARTVYGSPEADPAALLGFPDQDSVERHLIDAFLATAYDRRPGRARRYLTTLADLMGDGREFEWWQLHRVVSPLRPGFVVAFVGAVLGGWAGSLVTLPPGAGWRRIVVVVVFAALGWVYLMANLVGPSDAEGRPLMSGPRPRRLALTFARRLPGEGLILNVDVAYPYFLGAGIGLFPALAVICGYGRWQGATIILVFIGLTGVGAISGMLLGILYRWLSAPVQADRAASPLSVLRQDRAAALLALPPHLLVCGAAAMFLGADLSQRPTPSTPTNVAAVVFGLALGAAAWVGYALTYTAWGWFCLVRVRLALAGVLPWRLMAFLADAHRRNVLRQAGPAYQFRHSRLQDYLRAGNTS
jgi:hypothetical protein